MKKKSRSLLADFCFQAMLLLLFLGVIFLSYDNRHLVFNGIMFCIVIAFLMITYFTSLKTGLILDIIFVLLLFSYTCFQAIDKGIRITANIYFWLIWPGLMITCVASYVKQNLQMEKEITELNGQIEKYVTIDNLTQMNNLLAFERDTKVYMNISVRYKMDLALVLWRLSYQEELEMLMGKEALKVLVGQVSDRIRRTLRKEDLIYLVSNEPYIWGALFFAKADNVGIASSHVKEAVEKMDLMDVTKQNKIPLLLLNAVSIYDKSQMTPLSFLSKTKDKSWSEIFIDKEESETEKDKSNIDRSKLW